MEIDDLNGWKSKCLAAENRIKHLTDWARKDDQEICQLLGQALGYPKYSDHQEVFPGTEGTEVCTADHTGVTLAMGAAARIAELGAYIDRLERKSSTQEHEIKRKIERIFEAEGLLASATDLLNSWARETGGIEQGKPETIQRLISDLWNSCAVKYHQQLERAHAQTERIAELKKERDTFREQFLKSHADGWDLVLERISDKAEISDLRQKLNAARAALERVKRVSCGEDQLEDHVASDDTETLGYLYRFCLEALAATSEPSQK